MIAIGLLLVRMLCDLSFPKISSGLGIASSDRITA